MKKSLFSFAFSSNYLQDEFLTSYHRLIESGLHLIESYNINTAKKLFSQEYLRGEFAIFFICSSDAPKYDIIWTENGDVMDSFISEILKYKSWILAS